MKSWLQYNYIETYSTHNERKFAVAERFIRTLKNKIYKFTTSISKNVYTDKLAHIVTKCNNTNRSAIKMTSVDVKCRRYITFSTENKHKDLILKVADPVRISKCKNIFVAGYVLNSSEVKKVKITVLWA